MEEFICRIFLIFKYFKTLVYYKLAAKLEVVINIFLFRIIQFQKKQYVKKILRVPCRTSLDRMSLGRVSPGHNSSVDESSERSRGSRPC